MTIVALCLAIASIVLSCFSVWHHAKFITQMHEYYGVRHDYLTNTVVTYLSARHTTEAAQAKAIHDAAVMEAQLLRQMARKDVKPSEKSVQAHPHHAEPPRTMHMNGEEYERIDGPNELI